MFKNLVCFLAAGLTLGTVAVAASFENTAQRTATPTGSGLKQVTREMPAQVKSRRVAAAAENAVTVPFSYAMGKDSQDVDFIKANFTVINANNDSRTWNVCTTNKYSSCMAAKSGESERADDWLISMPVDFAAGSYKLTFDLGFMGATAKGASLEIALGSEPTAEEMTQTIAPEVLYTAKDQTTYSYDFRVAEAGIYYIGFHCTTSVGDAGAALLYNFGVEANAAAPANAVEVPFKHELGKDSKDVDFIKENYTTINANGDNRQWQVASVNGYSACMAPNADDIDANDDWLITMPIHMTAGNYTVAFDLGYMSGTGVILEVKLGTAPTVEGMTAEIVGPTTFTEKDQKTYEYNCAIPSDGYYYIGFHCMTTKDLKSALKLFNVSVEPGEVVVVDPPAAGTLTWVLAPKGELKATVTYTAPTKTISGADLKEITKVELTSRWTVDKFEFTDVVPGQVIVQEVPMYQGINNRFTGVAYVGDVAGEMVEYKSIFCGKDTPLAPENVTLKTTADYTGAVLSWDPVGEVGENGGYVDPEEVTYYIFDAFGSYYDPAIAETKKTSVTLSYPELVGQDLFAYQVTAGYEDNYSLDNASNIAIVGTPAELPFKESFPGGVYEGMWALDPLTDYYGQQYGTISDDYFAGMVDPDDPDSPEPLKSFDGDNGFFYWLPYEKNVMFGLMSLRADISKAANPVLEFRYQGQGSTIDVLVAGGTDDLEVVHTIDLKENPTQGWALCRVPLTDYKAAGAVNFEIRLTATHNDDEHTWSVPLDAIAVRDLVETDLSITSASASASRLAPGQTLTVKARIHNQGTEAADASAVLYVNGEQADELSLGELAADAFANAEFEYTVPLNAGDQLDVKVSAVADGDAIVSNNDFECTVGVKHLPYPTVGNLTAVAADNGKSVTLAWDEPVLDTPEPQTVFEDFESDEYVPMSISGAGDWTVYDGDGETTINVFSETYNPYQTKPMAFQLFNRDLANPYYDEDCDPHSGSSFMLAPTSYFADNDNWLISPELSGRAQTITFYAKSFSITWAESMEVLYSTTDNNHESFIAEPLLKVEAIENGWYMDGGVPEVWQKYEVELPEGAKHFAIRHFGWYTCALFVDDVTYEAVPEIPTDLTVTGYHVMRDNVLLTDEPVGDTNYVDTLPDHDSEIEVTYSVMPVYNYGVGRSEQIAVKASSSVETVEIAEIDANDAFYNLQGVRVNHSDIAPGVYIRVRANQAAKVYVK